LSSVSFSMSATKPFMADPSHVHDQIGTITGVNTPLNAPSQSHPSIRCARHVIAF
jgi:hypothetical protein